MACLAADTAAAPPAQTKPAAEDASAVRALIESARGGRGDAAASAAGGDGAVAHWAKANAASLTNVTAGPLPEQPWGLVTFAPAGAGAPARLFLHVFDWHAGGRLIVYGLDAASAKRAYLLADSPRAPLAIERRDRSTVLTVPKQPPDPLATVVVVETDGEPKAVPLAVDAAPDGVVVLHAKDSVVHGRTLRYEPEPHKDTVGYWTNPADWVHWEFTVAKPGAYAVEILQGCGKNSGGSTVDFAVGEQVLPVTVVDTGHFQNFVARDIGRVKLPAAGRYTLTVKPTKKQGAAVMDLRQVMLRPVGE